MRFHVHDSSAGGEADELRLLSTSDNKLTSALTAEASIS